MVTDRLRHVKSTCGRCPDPEPHDPVVTGPLPDEWLDALVLVLDEIRLGRSGSRSELVERTGLGRPIVSQRVGELVERGLVMRSGHRWLRANPR